MYENLSMCSTTLRSVKFSITVIQINNLVFIIERLPEETEVALFVFVLLSFTIYVVKNFFESKAFFKAEL